MKLQIIKSIHFGTRIRGIPKKRFAGLRVQTDANGKVIEMNPRMAILLKRKACIKIDNINKGYSVMDNRLQNLLEKIQG